MKSADECPLLSQSHNGVAESENCNDNGQTDTVTGSLEELTGDGSRKKATDAVASAGETTVDNFVASDDLATLGQNGSCQLWLYKCALDGCSAAFELLADLRTHFLCSHQPKGQMCVPCCFCMLEFPSWNSSVTSHIASHVRINSVSCVECKLKFESKNTLMKHLYSSHTGLPYGVSFDVSINNYERRRHRARAEALGSSRLEANANAVPDTAGPESLAQATAGLSSNLGTTGHGMIIDAVSHTKQHANEVVPESALEKSVDADIIVDRSTDSSLETVHDSLTVSSVDDLPNSSGLERAGGKKSGNTAECDDQIIGETFDRSQDADKTNCRVGRRKSRKPVRVANDESEEVISSVANDNKAEKAACDEDWVDVLSATQPMALQCSKCSYTCNTELNLKVHTYECHENPRGSVVGSMRWFTCRHCGAVSDNVSVHKLHVAHHYEKTAVPIRMFVCVYCDRRSDSMEVLEDHVLRDHPTETLKFEVLQLVVGYLQDMMGCPVCLGAYSWKEDLLRHFGAVHRLEGLVRYLESEYPAEPCPDKCRVPRSLFKDLMPHSKSQNLSDSKVETATALQSAAKQVDIRPVNMTSNHDYGSYDLENELLDLSAHGKKMHGSQVEPTDVSLNRDSIKNVDNISVLNRKQLRNEMQEGRKSVHGDDEIKSIQRFHCDICDFSANSHADLAEHAKSHQKETSGSYIATSSETRSYLLQRKDHKGKKHGLRFRCELCPFATSKSQNLRRHANIHIRANSMQEGFCCGYCSFAHKQRRCIIFHLSRYHGDLPVRFSSVIDGEVVDVTATVPQKSTQSSTKLASPAMNESNSQSLEPAACSVQSDSSTLNKTEETSASNTEDRLTSAVLSLEQQLPLSMIYATPVKCPLCDFANRVRVNLVRHIRLYHSDSAAKQKAPDSEKKSVKLAPAVSADVGLADVTASGGTLDMSSKMSSGSVPGTLGVFIPSADDSVFQQAQSTQCHVSFTANKSISTASVDEATESSIPFYRCTVCGYQSARQYSTKQHLLSVHRGSARFRCVICEHVLHTWRELAVHVWRSHAGQLPLVARQAFKDHAHYLRENITKIFGFHHMRCDVSKTSLDNEVGQKFPNADVTYAPPEASVPIKSHSSDLTGCSKAAEITEQPPKEVDVRRKTLLNTLQCRKCTYTSDNATVMRQHVMAHHLHYKPYACPYCDSSPRYVKSFPITKHVRIRHPNVTGNQRTFLYLRDEELEKKVRSGYRVIRQNNAGDVKGDLPPSNHNQRISHAASITRPHNEAPKPVKKGTDYDRGGLTEFTKSRLTSPKPSYQFSRVLDEHMKDPKEQDQKTTSNSPKKVVFSRCCFCGLVARWRADLRYHLMREIGYKPFRCGLCEEVSGKIFAEPTRPALAKHMRLRHPGIMVNVIEKRDPAKEEEIEQLLERCASSSLDLLPELTRSSAAVSVSESTAAVGAKPELTVVTSDHPEESDERSNVSQSGTDVQESSHVDQVEAVVVSNVNSDNVGVKSVSNAIAVQKSKKKKRTVLGKSRLRRCQYCSFRSPSIKNINKHAMEVHSYAPFKCSYCDFVEHYPSAMRRHWHQNHAEQSYSYVKVDINGAVLSVENRDSLPSNSAAVSINPCVEESNSESDDSSAVSAAADSLESSDVMEGVESATGFAAGTGNTTTALGRNTARKSTSYRSNYVKQDPSVSSEKYAMDFGAHCNSDSSSHQMDVAHDEDEVRFCCELCTASFVNAEDLSSHNVTCHANSVSPNSDSAAEYESDESESDGEILSNASSDRAANVVRHDGGLKLVVRLVDICWGLNSSKLAEGGNASSESDN